MNRKQRKRRREKRRVSTSGDRLEGHRALGGGIQETEVELDVEDEAQAAAFRKEFSQFAGQAPKQIKALREDLIDVLSPFGAFDIVANVLWMANTL